MYWYSDYLVWITVIYYMHVFWSDLLLVIWKLNHDRYLVKGILLDFIYLDFPELLLDVWQLKLYSSYLIL